MGDVEEYKRRLTQMEEKLRLVKENHAEEKAELNQTITELQTEQKVNSDDDKSGSADRMVNLESRDFPPHRDLACRGRTAPNACLLP